MANVPFLLHLVWALANGWASAEVYLNCGNGGWYDVRGGTCNSILPSLMRAVGEGWGRSLGLMRAVGEGWGGELVIQEQAFFWDAHVTPKTFLIVGIKTEEAVCAVFCIN